MPAANAGDVFLSATSFQPQEHLAVGTFEILIVLPVLQPFDELGGFHFPAGSELNVLPVLSEALFLISGQHPEKRDHIKREANKGKQGHTCK